MAQIEPRLALPAEAPDADLLTGGELLALVDALRDGTLNAQQKETLHARRAGGVGGAVLRGGLTGPAGYTGRTPKGRREIIAFVQVVSPVF
jgi:hypothetical protein